MPCARWSGNWCSRGPSISAGRSTLCRHRVVKSLLCRRLRRARRRLRLRLRPWLPSVFRATLDGLIRPTRQNVIYFGGPPGDERFGPGSTPAWIDRPAGIYGIPDVEDCGVKVGIDEHGPAIDPDGADRTPDAGAIARARAWVERRFPAMKGAPVVEARVCQHENINGDLLIDRHPAHDNVWLVGGGSGHGFKHGPGWRARGESGADWRRDASALSLATKGTHARGRCSDLIGSVVPMPRILVTNDDGVHSEGIALAAALAPFGDITTVAPIQEASAIGHALTLRRPLRIDTIGPNVFAVDGTPTDCVNLAITHVLKGKPDLIVSGINKGWNLGDDDLLDRPGALEGALLEIPSIAVSTQRVRDECEFGPSAVAAAIVAQSVLEQGLPKFTLLNINTPKGRTRVPCDCAGQAQPRHHGERAHGSPAQAILLDRRRGERVGAARPVGLPGGARRLHFDHTAAAGHDGA